MDLKSSLGVEANIEGGGFGVSFSASAGYKSASSTLKSGKFKFVKSTASCKYYFAKLNELDVPDFSPEVMRWIKKMNQTIKSTGTVDDDLLYDFVNYFGTHFPSEMVYGAKFTYQHKIESSKFEKMKSSEISINVQASYSGQFSLGGGFGLSVAQSEAAQQFSENVSTSTISIGAPPPYNGDAMTWASTVKDTPVPMQYSFIPIYELFDDGRLNVKRYLSRKHTRQIRDGLLRISSSYCRKLENEGLEVLCNDDSVLKITNFENTEMNSNLLLPRDKLNYTLDECLTECNKRKNCKMVTLYPSDHSYYKSGTQCRLDVNTKQGFRVNLSPCVGCNTYIDPHSLSKPIGMAELRYDLSVARLNEIGIPYYAGFDELNEFCALVCTSYRQCVGYEVSNSIRFKFNCATYREHGVNLVQTPLFDFETYIMPDSAKQAFRQAKLDYGILFYGLAMTSGEYSEVRNCEYECCRKLCVSNINCLALSTVKVKRCKMFMNDWNTEIVEVSKAPDVFEFFPERAMSGWLNLSIDTSLSKQLESNYHLNISSAIIANVTNADECASQCSNKIHCIAAAWELSTNCINYNYFKFFPPRTNSTTQNRRPNGFQIMIPNHRERIRLFKIGT